MRVYIGPYLNWWGPYQLFGWVKKLGVSDEAFERFLDNNKWIEKTCKWVFDLRDRTVIVKIDKYDSWNADHTIALIVLPILKQLQRTKHGSPLVEDEDVPEHLRSTNAKPKENEWDTDEFFHDRWEWVLGEMIWALEQISLDMPDEPNILTMKREDWRLDYEVYNDRIKRGTTLFGKYFRALWD